MTLTPRGGAPALVVNAKALKKGRCKRYDTETETSDPQADCAGERPQAEGMEREKKGGGIMERKTQKVLDICVEGVWFECVRHNGKKVNAYKLYRCWWDCGKHRKKVEEYGNFVSVIEHIRFFCYEKNWGFKDSF